MPNNVRGARLGRQAWAQDVHLSAKGRVPAMGGI